MNDSCKTIYIQYEECFHLDCCQRDENTVYKFINDFVFVSRILYLSVGTNNKPSGFQYFYIY